MFDPIINTNDIKNLAKKSSASKEYFVLSRYENALETKIQSHARNCFLALKQEISFKFPDAKMEFIQLDNGGKLTASGRIRKWQEGTASGFPDVMILVSKKEKSLTIFVEFKRIGTPSQIVVSDNQKDWNKKLKMMGFSAYITNNPLFFEKEICGEIKNFLSF